MVALGRVVLSTREHVIALEARDKGILGMLLHYPYEVRKPVEYFGDIPNQKAPQEMLDLAAHIIDTMAGHFDPEKFDDRYEDALRDIIKRKAAGEKITPAEHPRPKTTTNLMDALRASLEGTHKRPPAASVHRRSAGGRRKPGAQQGSAQSSELTRGSANYRKRTPEGVGSCAPDIAAAVRRSFSSASLSSSHSSPECRCSRELFWTGGKPSLRNKGANLFAIVWLKRDTWSRRKPQSCQALPMRSQPLSCGT